MAGFKIRCFDCEKEIEIKDAIGFEGKNYCPDCFIANKCAVCGEWLECGQCVNCEEEGNDL